MNQIDGKLVEVEPNPGKEIALMGAGETTSYQMISTRGSRTADDLNTEKEIPSLSVFNKKVASLNQEYTAMLASTLES